MKGKDTKVIITRNHKVMNAVMFCDSKYAIDKDTRNNVSNLVSILEGTLLMCLLKT